jgi:hypothetical protein
MKHITPIPLLCCLASVFLACTTAPRPVQPTASATDPGGTGMSCNDPVRIDAKSEPEGIAAESRWIQQHYPGYKKTRQGIVLDCGGRPGDAITIESPDGHTVHLYFDISSFLGKFG